MLSAPNCVSRLPFCKLGAYVESVNAPRARVLLLRRWHWAVHEWVGGSILWLYQAGVRWGGRSGCCAVVFGLLRCIFMTVFKHPSQRFTAPPPDRSGPAPRRATVRRPRDVQQEGWRSGGAAGVEGGRKEKKKTEKRKEAISNPSRTPRAGE